MLTETLRNAFDYKRYLISNTYGGTGDNVKDDFIKALQNSSKPHPTPTSQVITPQNSEEIAVMNEYYLFLWKYYVLDEKPKEEPKIEEPLIERIDLSEGPKINEEKLFTTPEESQRREFEFEGETRPIPSGISSGDITPVNIEELEPRVESEKTTEIVEKVVEKIKVEKLLETEVETVIEKTPVVNNISQKFFSEENLDNLVNEIKNDDVVIKKVSTEIVSDVKEDIKEDIDLDNEDLDSLLSEIRNEDSNIDASLRPVEVVSDEETTSVDDPEKITEVLETTKEQIREEVKEEVREEVKDDLDILLEQIREETAKEREEESKEQKINTTKLLVPAKDDNEKIISKLQETNKNLLSINELLLNLNLGLQKSIIDEKKRLFKQRDRERKSVRKSSFLSKPRTSGRGGRGTGINPIETGGIFDFLLYSVLAGLVDYIPKLVKTVENFANSVREFFEDLPYNIGKSIGNAIQRIQEFIDGITEKFRPKIEEIKNTVLEFFEEQKQKILESFDNIYSSIDDFTNGKLTEFVDMLKNTGTFLKDQASNLYNAIDDFTGGKLTDTKNFIGDKVITPMQTFFSEQLQALTSGVTGLFDKAKEGFLNLVPEEMKQGFGDVFRPEQMADISEGPVLTIGGQTAVAVGKQTGGEVVQTETSEETMEKIQTSNIAGKTLRLGTSGSSAEQVGQQLRLAEEKGAKGVQVLGTGNEEKDATIQEMVGRMSNFAQFVPASVDEGGKVNVQKTAAAAESMRAGTKGGSISGSGAIGTKEQRALLDAISFAEGTTRSYGTIFGGNVIPELERGELTIAQVLEMQKTGKLNGRDVGYGTSYPSDATGRYQFMSYVLEEEAQKQNIPMDAKFTPTLQDKMILGRLARFRKVTPELLKKEGLSTNVLDKLAPEFASFPYSPKGNKSYYDQPVKSPESIRQAFNSAIGARREKSPRSPRPSPRQVLDARDSGVTDNAQGRSSQPQTPISPRGRTDNPYGMVVTSDFGKMRGLAISPGKHMGVDIAGPKGVPLQAFTDAEITATSPPDAGYGNWVAWKDVQGIEHFYGHMVSPTPFKVGDKVKKGTKLGEVGSTGESTGPHLHWEAATVPGDTGRPKSAVLSRINPLSKYSEFAPFGGESKPSAKNTEVSIPKPAAAVAAVTDRATGVSKQIARPSGRKGTNITTMDLPGGAGQQTPVSLPEKPGQVNNLPFVNTSYSDDVYKIHTRSVFNIVG